MLFCLPSLAEKVYPARQKVLLLASKVKRERHNTGSMGIGYFERSLLHIFGRLG